MPLSEFEDLEELLIGGFPQVFMLGVAFSPDEESKKTLDDANKNKKLAHKGLSNDNIKHMLLQFTSATATSRELLFYLFDYQMRHAVTNQKESIGIQKIYGHDQFG